MGALCKREKYGITKQALRALCKGANTGGVHPSGALSTSSLTMVSAILVIAR